MSNKLTKVLPELRRRYEQIRSLMNQQERANNLRIDALHAKFYDQYWRQAAKHIGADIEAIGYGYYKISLGGFSTFVRNGNVMLDDHLSLCMAGNKPLIHGMLADIGVRVPKYFEYDLSTLSDADKFMQQIGGDFVVKPAADTGGGRGITTKINSFERLKTASFRASAHSKVLVIEEEVPGDSYRLLYLNGKLIDAIRRDCHSVVGDGVSSVKKLISQENEQRLSDEIITSLNPLSIDLECQYTLLDQGLSLKSVPILGDVVRVKSTSNQNWHKENHNVMSDVCDSLVSLGTELSSMLDLQLSGVDILTNDIGLSLEESGGVVNEVNTTPSFYHHYLISDPEKRIPVGELVLEHIFALKKDRDLAKML